MDKRMQKHRTEKNVVCLLLCGVAGKSVVRGVYVVRQPQFWKGRQIVRVEMAIP